MTTVGGILLIPVEAAKEAHQVDVLFYATVGLSVFIVVLVFALLIGFTARYRAGSAVSRRPLPRILSHEVEITWTLATFFGFLELFWWASTLNLIHLRPPPHTLDIHVVAKQWMWKVEQPNGVREIDEVHMPVDTPVRLIMNSQDVIHSFYVPNFREKQDVVPGMTTTLWFTPSRIGAYPLRCAEYCGDYHSKMTGQIVVMSKAGYARWADSMKRGPQVSEKSP